MADIEDRIIRIESKIDKVVDHLGSIDSTLAAQHESLKIHIKRSDLLEAQVEPLKTHVAMVAGALKLIGVIVAACGAIEGIVMLLEYLRK